MPFIAAVMIKVFATIALMAPTIRIPCPAEEETFEFNIEDELTRESLLIPSNVTAPPLPPQLLTYVFVIHIMRHYDKKEEPYINSIYCKIRRIEYIYPCRLR